MSLYKLLARKLDQQEVDALVRDEVAHIVHACQPEEII